MARAKKNNVPTDQPDLFHEGQGNAVAGSLTRRFLGWERSLLRAVAEHLAAEWDGHGALDLDGWLIIVPTRNAGRRLREALAMLAAEKNAAVLPPRVVTPDFLTSPERLEDVQTADSMQTRLIWAAELLRLDFAAHRQLFPVDPVERGLKWALKTAGDLLELRETLNEKGLSMADAARLFENTAMEPERWLDLAKIELQCVLATEQYGLLDWQVARRRAAALGKPPAGLRRVVMAGVTDPSALAIEALQRWARSVPVEVLIYAPEATHGGCYDAFGRPVPEVWLTRQIVIPEPESTIHIAGSPVEQADAAADMLRGYDDPGSIAALGVADAVVTAPLEKALEARGINAFDPAGRSMSTHGIFYLLRLLARITDTRSFRSVAELLRCPDITETIRHHLKNAEDENPSLSRLLDDFDTLAAEALPDTLDDALELAPRVFSGPRREGSAVPSALAWIDSRLQKLAGGDFGAALAEFLGEIFERRSFRTDRPQDAVFVEIAKQITSVLDTLEGSVVEKIPGGLDVASKLELLLLALEGQSYYPDRRARDIDLQGWLELLWEDAPHLIITGMNDGKAPESILGHAFLPDSARRALGLRHNDTRFARDAALLDTLIGSRKERGGRVDLLFGRTGAEDEPLRPSRLLFQCSDAELASRVLHFFKKPPSRADIVPWRLAWQLQPQPLSDAASVFHKLSVTSFRSYLTCPFRFYLSHGLRMQEVGTAGGEMESMDFGNLLHAVLEAFAKEPAARDSEDAEVIRAAFHALLDRHLHGKYGARLTVPVMIQREAARQRLGWWADEEAAQRRDGWRILAAETPISTDEEPWLLAGMRINGTVDRIERHPQRGVRLIDFKSYSPYDAVKRTRRTVEEYHIAKLKRSDEPALLPPWQLTTTSEGDAARWTDLQLPLYRLAMQRRYAGERLTAAYVTLGRTRADLGLDEWPALEGEMLQSAQACAEGIIAAIRARTFWPPAEKMPFSDDFEALFLGDVLAAVDASALTSVPK
ncbi:MAG: PD-(D/E)XK nuclease family protein [Verrucomicrobiaceae bacterium]|nr:PD-(D/E)XK nuclease family protein [Verrucomicrobiaceae bacterium]